MSIEDPNKGIEKSKMTLEEWKLWRDKSPNEYKALHCPHCEQESLHLPEVNQEGSVVCQESKDAEEISDIKGCGGRHNILE